MLLLARLVALSIGIAVLMLFVLPGLLELQDEDIGGAPDVKVAKNTTWDNETAPAPDRPAGAAQQTRPRSSASGTFSTPPERPKSPTATKEEHATAPTPPKTSPDAPTKRKRFYRVLVRDAGTLKTGNHMIRLEGIEVRGQDEKCEDSSGTSWPCGTRARAALTRLIRGRAVVCDVPENDRTEITARCRIGETDLSHWMVAQGWAQPATESNETLTKARDEAKQAQLGLWGGARQVRPEPVYNEPVPVFEQEPIDDDPVDQDSEPLYQEWEPGYDQ